MGTENPLTGKSIFVSGGTGTFGNAFARKALLDGASRVVVFSRGEAKQAQMAAELPDPRTRYFIGDVRDERRVREAVRGCDVVVHAAALKRVEVCEQDPGEAIATNVLGSINVARACIEHGVEKAVCLSTDKAAAPNTLYGATKLCAERAWCRWNVYAAGTRTRFAATRYGNVLGSTGSVVPLWRGQHARGEALTVTQADCSRFWMSIDAAVDLVMLALREMRGGEVFVPKVGSSTIATLADAVAPGATWTECGLRPGEKIHETLISDEESRRAVDLIGHYVILPEAPTWEAGSEARHTQMRYCLGQAPVYRSDTNPEQLTVEALREMTK